MIVIKSFIILMLGVLIHYSTSESIKSEISSVVENPELSIFRRLSEGKQFDIVSTNMANAMIEVAKAAIDGSYNSAGNPLGRVKYIANYLAIRYPSSRWNVVEQFDAITFHQNVYIHVRKQRYLQWTEFLIYSI